MFRLKQETGSSDSTSPSAQTYDSPFFFDLAILILFTIAICSQRRSIRMHTMFFYVFNVPD